ncbi:murein L,D-transpeptidase [Sphingomonas crocodyli]|uniref:Murein L,D-transpeptidase n=2 Tax=Sphingomonas crocodyli TaxID=1979270 RepID=A0A437LZ43_9SPHN|nr:murein L,D-transpeptidase [Sphingomonas crocodyli]
MVLSVETTADGASRDAALTKIALRYAGMLATGASDPKKLHKVFTLARPEVDLRAGLAKALNDGKLGEWLDSLAPEDAHYAQLSKAYVALVQTGQKVTAAIPDQGKAIEPGATDTRIPAIVRQLGTTGYLPEGGASENVYAPRVVAAVRRVQADYGIRPDGIIGGEALAILNLSDADRARAIAVAMERMRWLAQQPPATRIDVNVAAAMLSYWRDGKLVDTRRVVVGEPDTETPQLQSPVYRLVANPTWTVPRSIQAKEIEGKGSNYLKRNNMVWKDGWVVQQPGPKNSLGLVKFDMQNDHAIYLHDTPAKALFNEAQRQRSHGCIRVFDALGFAAMIARDENVLDAWNKARATGKESFVSLPRQIPVRLLYQTVLVDKRGNPIVRADPYGWDDAVAKALGFGSQPGHRVRSGSSEVAP